MRNPWFLGALLAVSAAGCSSGDAPRSYPIDEAPAELAPYAQQAGAAFEAMKKKLMPLLMQGLEKGGPVEAIPFCKVEAPRLEGGAAFPAGRTSHKLRNPENAPREWMKPILAAAAGRKARDVEPTVVDLGDRVGVAAPIGAMKFCLACHGGENDIAAETRAALQEAYPQDQATGFAEGDVRGFFWAELDKTP